MALVIAACLIMTTVSNSAHAASTDYDGTWRMTVACGPSMLQDPPYSYSANVTIVDGQFKLARKSRAMADDTRSNLVTYTDAWIGTLKGSVLTVTSTNTADDISIRPSNYSFSGPASSAERFTLSGAIYNPRGQLRGCTLTLVSIIPAPASLAARQHPPIVVGLGSVGRSDDSSVSSPSISPEEETRRAFVRSLRADDVRRVQTALKRQGLYDGAIDGLWGPTTDASVRKWQSAHGLPSTAILSSEQMAQLLQSPTMGEGNHPKVSAPGISSTTDDLAEREKQLANRERLLAEREQKIAKERAAQEQAVHDKQLAEERAAKERATEEEQKRSAAEREQKEQELDERERRLAEREKTVSEQEKQLQSRQTDTSSPAEPTISLPAPFRWTSGFGQGTAVATINNRRGSSLQFSCNSGGLPPIAPSLTVTFKDHPIAGEISYQFVVDGKNYPVSLKDGRLAAITTWQRNTLAATAEALARSDSASFRVEVPDAGVAEEFSLLNAKDALGMPGRTLAACSVPTQNAIVSPTPPAGSAKLYTQADIDALRLRFVNDPNRPLPLGRSPGNMGELRSSLVRDGWKEAKYYPGKRYCAYDFSRASQTIFVMIYCAGNGDENTVAGIDLKKADASIVPSGSDSTQVGWKDFTGGWILAEDMNERCKPGVPLALSNLKIDAKTISEGLEYFCTVSQISRRSNTKLDLGLTCTEEGSSGKLSDTATLELRGDSLIYQRRSTHMTLRRCAYMK